MHATSRLKTRESTAGAVKRLTLDASDGAQTRRIEVDLDAGHVYHAIVESPTVRRTLIEQLVDTALAAIVPVDGGLIGNLKVWENLVLPSAYHRNAKSSELEPHATRLFAEFGITGAAFEALCTTLPDHLGRFERRLCAFVRALLTEPRIIVYDSLFEGLSRDETNMALSFDRTFRTRLPLGTSLHLTSDIPTLPELGARRTFKL